MSPIRVAVRRLRPDARLPVYATAGAAGLDLAACLDAPMTIAPHGSAAIPTGLAIALPARHEAQVRPRSGLAARASVTVLNAPGTIDEDYRGEIKVLLVNLGTEPFVVVHGDRIAQMVVVPVPPVVIDEVDSLPAPFDRPPPGGTSRGERGFGSTGR